VKIAIIAPVIRKISTKNLYGGIERIITSLVNGATDAGHKVILYAPFGTDLEHNNLEVRITTNKDVSGEPELIKIAEAELFKRIIDEQQQFDIIHTHIEPIVAKVGDNNYFNQIVKPVVITFHNQTHIDENINYYKSHKELNKLNYVFISRDQAAPLNFLPSQIVIYNGIDLDGLTFNATPNPGQLAFVGRITPEKGISQAIAIAKMAGKKLLIAAAIDHSQQDYYENQIKPQLDGKQIVYLGEISNESKNEMLRTSEALLFPIRWHEPFGLVITEAMATGTPVIATDIGSVVEIVEEGKTGFTVSDIDNIKSYVDKLENIHSIDRKYCRQVVENKFTDSIMVSNYLKYYKSLLK
jgi:glycosyltransferase involved in cell wall biosynthesis